MNQSKAGIRTEVQWFLFRTAVLVFAAFLLFGFVLRINRAEGNALAPYVQDGDLGIFLRLGEIAEGDVVLVQNKEGSLGPCRVTSVNSSKDDSEVEQRYTVETNDSSEKVSKDQMEGVLVLLVRRRGF